MAFFLPLYWLPCQHASASITCVLARALYSTIEVLLGDGGRFQVWRHSQVLLSDVVFWGSVWTLTSKVVQFCEAPPCSFSKQPHVGSLHDAPAIPLSSTSNLFPPVFQYLTTTIITYMVREVPLPPAPPLPLLILLPLCAYLLF